ncbi:MAG: nucleoside-diphosphate kinase [Bacteroidales bacterium]|nr:nucleoside-diphosphate kinase [Bacteroidales bacterium]
MEQTFALIKPLAFQNNLTGPILNMINQAGFRIAAIKGVWLSKREAHRLYAVHQGLSFFDGLVEYMTSGPIMVMVLEKENAIEDLRQMMGKTDPQEAQEGTIRRLYGINKRKNAIHGSDSPENAEKESALFFSQLERF